jgi:lipid II isoglutaminyl synthase (glutamine-hydrolysing)
MGDLFEQVWLNGRLEEHLESVYAHRSEPAVIVDLARAASLTYTKLAVARAAGRVSRASGRGGGTTAPGRLLLQMAPGAIATLAARLVDGVVLVSATNGKTTTARMLATILAADGRRVVHNRIGANTHWGISTALAEGDGDVGVFEVDEAWLPLLAAEIRPRLIVLGNLSRDRLDGYGELDRLVALWRALLRGASAPPTVVANADDPLLAGRGGVLEGASATPVLFGIADPAGDSASADVRAVAVRQRGLDGTGVTIALPAATFPIELRQPGLHNVHNALAAAAAALSLGVAPEVIRTGLQSARPAFGRSETIVVQGRTVHLCLVKNPAGVNATLRLLRSDRRWHPLHLWLALNDDGADGRDVSWIWDADFEHLAGLIGGATCSGRRAHELALRLKYAGWVCPIDVEEDLERSFDQALQRTPGSLIALPTYTALLGLRGVLNRRGVAVSDWGTTARSA